MDEQGNSLLAAGTTNINVQGISGEHVENLCVAGIVYGGMGSTNATSVDAMIGQSKSIMNSINVELHVTTEFEGSAVRLLESSGCILITGKSGTGKTTLGLRLLSQVSQQTKRNPIVLSSPQQLDLLNFGETMGKNGLKYILMIDNIFGSTNFVKSHLEKWEKRFDLLWPYIESEQILLVMTSRHDIFQQCDKSVNKYIIFKHAGKLLLDDSLTDDEKKRLIKRYSGSKFTESQLSKILNSKTEYAFGFPLCCRHFSECALVQKQGIKFFLNPKEGIVFEIDRLKQNDQLGFFTLLVVLTNDSCLKIKHLEPPISEEFQCFLEKIRQFCNLKAIPTLNAIREKAKQLCGIYLFQSQIGFHFQHQSSLDAVALSISQDYLNMFIRVCPVGVMMEFVRLESDSEAKNDKVICISEDLYLSLAKRLIELIVTRKSSDILGHQAFSDQTFSKVMLDMFLAGDIAETLSTELDEKSVILDTFNIINVSYYKPLTDLHGLFDITHILSYRCLLSHLIMNQSGFLSFLADQMQNFKTKLQVSVLMEALCCAIYAGAASIAKVLFLENENLSFSCFRILIVSPKTDESFMQQGFQHFSLGSLHPKEISKLLSLAVQFGNCCALTWLTENLTQNVSIFSECLIQLLLQSSREIQRRPQFVPSISRQITPIMELLFRTGCSYEPLQLLCLASGHDDTSALRCILRNVDTIDINNPRSQHFHLACRFGSFECVNELLFRGMDLHIAGTLNRSFSLPKYLPRSLLPVSFHGAERYNSGSFPPLPCVNEPTHCEYVHIAIQSELDSLEKVKIILIALSKKYSPEVAKRNLVDLSNSTTTLLNKEYFLNSTSLDKFINCSDENGSKPLHYAAVQGKSEIVKHLLEAGAYVDARDGWGLTPLMCALIGSNPDCVNILRCNGGAISISRSQDFLSHIISYFPGSDISSVFLHPYVLHYNVRKTKVNIEKLRELFELIQDEDNYPKLVDSALFTSIHSGNTEALNFLLSKGADVNRRDNLGQTSAHAAARKDLSMLKHICKTGVDVNIVDASGKTVLEEAANSDIDIIDKIEYLLKVENASLAAGIDGKTVLFTAVERGDIELVHYLAANGLSVNHRDIRGSSLLHEACKMNGDKNIKILQTLFDLKIKVPYTDENGQNPLHIACEKGNLQMFQFLLSKTFPLLAQDNQGRSILHLAAASGNKELVQLIITREEDYPKTDKDGKTPLHYAALWNHVSVIDLFLMRIPQFNSKDFQGRTALLYAIRNSHVEVASTFIRQMLNIDDKDNYGVSPLHAAVEANSDVIVHQLLAANVNVSVINNKGQTVLHLAILKKYYDILENLLRSDIDINIQDNDGKTALHYSVYQQNKYVLQILVERGIDTNVKDDCGNTALHYSCSMPTAEIFKMLVAVGADTTITDNKGKTVFHKAVESDNLDVILVLFERDMYVVHADKDGNTPLHLAAATGSLSTLKLLLNKTLSDVSMQNNQGKSPLHLAAMSNHVSCFNLLKDHGADLTLCDNSGTRAADIRRRCNNGSNFDTSDSDDSDDVKSKHASDDYEYNIDIRMNKKKKQLHQAVQKGEYDRIIRLLDGGANPSQQDINGNTSLHLAVRRGELRIVELLFMYNVDITLKDNADHTALDIADNLNKEDIKDILLVNMCIGHSQQGELEHVNNRGNHSVMIPSYPKPLPSAGSLLCCVKSGNAQDVRVHLKGTDNISDTDGQGRAAVHYATMRGESDVLQVLLLKHRSQCSVKDKNGRTPVHIAAKHGRYTQMKLLIDIGADLNVQDNNGLTPLHYATILGDFDMVALLVDNYSDPNIKNPSNQTALHLAAEIGNDLIIPYLLHAGCDVLAMDKDGKTALELARENSHMHCASHLENTTEAKNNVDHEDAGAKLDSEPIFTPYRSSLFLNFKERERRPSF